MKKFSNVLLFLVIMLSLVGCNGALSNVKVDDKLDVKHLRQGSWAYPGPMIVANVEILHKNPAGEVIDRRVEKNIVVNAGKAGVASRINGDGAAAVFNYVAIGTGSAAAAATDTTLGTEIAADGGQRATATVSRITTTVTNDTAKWLITYNFTGSYAVTESGIFNAASAGTMLARRVFAAINVASGDSIQITWTTQAQ